jgi:hypothetical protein
MRANSSKYIASLIAELCISRAVAPGRTGVFAENMPPFDTDLFLRGVESSKPRIRVALLGGPSIKTTETVTADPMVANKWRNDEAARKGTRSIYLVLGPASKINSLRSALPNVSASDVRAFVIQRLIALHATPERKAYLGAVAALSGDIPITPLMLYAETLGEAASKGASALLFAEPHALRKLGIVPYQAITQSPTIPVARKAIRRSLRLVEKLKSLTPKLRAALAQIIEAGAEGADEAARILKFNRTHNLADLGTLTGEQIEALFDARAKSGKDEDKRATRDAKPRREEGDLVALDLILDGAKGCGVAAKRFAETIEPDPEGVIDTDVVQVGARQVLPRVRTGTTQAASVFSLLIADDVWGGVLAAPAAADHVAAMKLVGSDDGVTTELFRPEEENEVGEIIKRAVNRALAPRSTLDAWQGYASARSSILPHTAALIDHPLLALAGDKRLYENVQTVIATHKVALSAIKDLAHALEQQGSADASRRLIAKAMVLDIVFIQSAKDFVAITAPTHPFHLWRWITLLDLLQQHTAEVNAIGRETVEPLITDPPTVCPQIVLSPYAVSTSLARPYPFIAGGTFASLPLFVEPTARLTSSFRARSLGKLAERLVRLMPHAALGLRVALVDPPSISAAVEDLLDIPNPIEYEASVPVHVVVLRTKRQSDQTEEEEELLGQMVGELADQGGSISILPELASANDLLPALQRRPMHMTVVFHPGNSEEMRLGIARPPPLSPLIVPRAYRYDAFDDRLDLVIAGDTEPFRSYHEMFCKTIGIPMESFVGRRSGASMMAKKLEAIASTCVWLTVVDQAVEPTLRIIGAERLDWRSEAGRDLVTFSAHPQTIEDLVRDALKVTGHLPDDETTKRVLNEMLLLNGEGILALARPRPDLTQSDPRLAKGIFGVLAAQRWYLQKHPDALVISLDEPASRKWILGAGSDDRHGDLLGIYSSADGIVVEAIEVKTHEAEAAGISVNGGRLTGQAVEQVEQTLSILESVFARKMVSPIVAARKEILRDQLYRAIASRPYSADTRGRFIQILEQLFIQGPGTLSGLICRVRTGGSTGSEAEPPKLGRGPANREIALVDVFEGLTTSKGKPPAGVDVVPPTPKPRQPAAASQALPTAPSPSAAAKRDPSVNSERLAIRGTEVKILIGRAPDDTEVYWEPHKPNAQLNNFGFLITGDPGSGKTQLIKSLISFIADANYPVCIFDFKNDYSDEGFARKHRLDVYDIDRQGLPFNPLSLIADERGEVQPIRQVHEVVGILSRIYQLGDQQSARLRKAIARAYEALGIAPDQRVLASKVTAVPSFDDVKAILESDPKNEPLLNRLSPLLDLNLFPTSERSGTTFEQIIASRVVLDLHSLPADPIKAAMSEFMIVRLHSHILKGDQPRELRRLLVFDEAWRVKESIRLQELAREGRAFGVGIVVGTQFPGDIPENLAGNLATQVLLGNQNADHLRAVVRALCGATSGPEAQRLQRLGAQLKKHQGFLRNQQFSPYVLTDTIPYYQRT